MAETVLGFASSHGPTTGTPPSSGQICRCSPRCPTGRMRRPRRERPPTTAPRPARPPRCGSIPTNRDLAHHFMDGLVEEGIDAVVARTKRLHSQPRARALTLSQSPRTVLCGPCPDWFDVLVLGGAFS